MAALPILVALLRVLVAALPVFVATPPVLGPAIPVLVAGIPILVSRFLILLSRTSPSFQRLLFAPQPGLIRDFSYLMQRSRFPYAALRHQHRTSAVEISLTTASSPGASRWSRRRRSSASCAGCSSRAVPVPCPRAADPSASSQVRDSSLRHP